MTKRIFKFDLEVTDITDRLARIEQRWDALKVEKQDPLEQLKRRVEALESAK